jgi:hypothetical protein
MWCNDPVLTLLKSSGYNAIRLPKADCRPLQIMSRSGKDLNRLGELTTLLVAGSEVGPPPIDSDVPAATISGSRTSDLSLGIGLTILGNILGAMGGSKLGLSASYQAAKTVAFEFQEVLEDKVSIALLDQYLGQADVNPFSRYVADLLESDEVYVTTATIKSRKFVVEAKVSEKQALSVDVPVLQEAVGGNVTVSSQGGSSSKIAYEGKIPLVFGFQAVRLYYKDGRYTSFKVLEPEDAAMRELGSVPSDGADRLMTDGLFVRLSEGA